MRLRAAALGLLAVAAGCAAPPAPPPSRVSFVPDAAGLAVAGTPMRVDFGRAPGGVVRALTREMGAPTPLPLVGCPAAVSDRLRWGDLDLTFTSERFVGWSRGGDSAGQTCG